MYVSEALARFARSRIHIRESFLSGTFSGVLPSLPTKLTFKRSEEWPLFLHVVFNILSSIYTAGSSWIKCWI